MFFKHHSATQTHKHRHAFCLTQHNFLPLSAIEKNNCRSSFRQWCKCRLSCFDCNTHYEVKHRAVLRALILLPFWDGVIVGLYYFSGLWPAHRTCLQSATLLGKSVWLKWGWQSAIYCRFGCQRLDVRPSDVLSEIFGKWNLFEKSPKQVYSRVFHYVVCTGDILQIHAQHCFFKAYKTITKSACL